MGEIFFYVLILSLLGSVAILWVLLASIFMKRLPRFFLYGLWLVVFVRLICPFSMENSYGLMLLTIGQLEDQSRIVTYPYGDYYRSFRQGFEDGYKEGREAHNLEDEWQNSKQMMNESNGEYMNQAREISYTFIDLVGIVWLVGVIACSYRDMRHYHKLRKSLRESQCIEDNLYHYKGTTSFVFGVFHPKIYVPWEISADEANYIIQHEQVHIKRKDYIVKLIASIIVNIHWFNPLVWLAFSKMSQEMEISCDERVIKNNEKGMRKAYATLLLQHAENKELKPMLMFGKHPVQKRVQHILGYKEAKKWKYLLAGIIVLAVGSGIMTQSTAQGKEIIVGDNGIKGALEDRQSGKIRTGPQAASISPDMMIGVQGVSLDYASKRHIIFHDYFGLFIYDVEGKRLTHTLNLKAIGCEGMQGDAYCEVVVNQEGTIVLLHPILSEKMWVYDIKNNTLTKQDVELFKEPFRTKENPTPSGSVSYNVVTLPNGEMGYLSYEGGMLKDIVYHVGSQSYLVFEGVFGEGNEGFIARILKIDRQKKLLLVEGMSENSPLGDQCEVKCSKANYYKWSTDLSLVSTSLEWFKEGDVISLQVDGIKETYPTKTSAEKVIWLEGEKEVMGEEMNYSVAYIPKEGNPVFLENIEGDRKRLLERLREYWLFTSMALPGKQESELGSYYRILCDIEGKQETYLIYPMGNKFYFQPSVAEKEGQVVSCKEVKSNDYEEIASWFK